jgi:anti-sigma factor ChrR (cupin superfamily)
MYPYLTNESQQPWKSLDFPGVSIKVLYTDDSTGASTVLTRLSKGSTIPAHTHSQADETVYVLHGDFVEDGESHGPGTFFAAKAGVLHGPHSSETGCVVLTQFSKTLDFVLEKQMTETKGM